MGSVCEALLDTGGISVYEYSYGQTLADLLGCSGRTALCPRKGCVATVLEESVEHLD